MTPPPAAPADPHNTTRKPARRPDDKAEPVPAPPTWTPLPPMRPHRKLFIVLLLTWVLWCGALIAMYFTVVRRHPQPTRPQPATAPALALPDRATA
jgi:hypothetical protein